MRTASFLLFLVSLGVQSSIHAQEAKDPIEQTYDACLAGPAANNTAGQVGCATKAAAAWDQELNRVYQKLMKTLDPSSQALLRASQRQWLAFRDAEKKFQAGPWLQKQGTLAEVTANMANVDILKSRVLTLRNYAGGGNPN